MENDIAYLKKKLFPKLPSSLYIVCEKILDTYPDVSEIRLRKGKRITFTLRERNIETSCICDDPLISDCLSLWLGTERYKKTDCLINGSIALPGGIRIGIAGTALINKGVLTDVYNISAINVRLPRIIRNVAAPLYDYVTALPYPHRSTLLLSPPCNGKTTVLRDLAYILSTAPVSERVCIVDPQQELAPYDDNEAFTADVFNGYPTPLGIEIATRYFNPRYIICDEIGTSDELNAVKNAAHAGIPLIASSHASSLSEAIDRPVLRDLLENNVFRNVAELKLSDQGPLFRFLDRKEVDNALCQQPSLSQF